MTKKGVYRYGTKHAPPWLGFGVSPVVSRESDSNLPQGPLPDYSNTHVHAVAVAASGRLAYGPKGKGLKDTHVCFCTSYQTDTKRKDKQTLSWRK